ncbi:hypothetical protein QJS66_18660 [Kocuria rhizophila]|nr:hypothetical protein QJS66_18660 [Kocuria rhizophila]
MVHRPGSGAPDDAGEPLTSADHPVLEPAHRHVPGPRPPAPASNQGSAVRGGGGARTGGRGADRRTRGPDQRVYHGPEPAASRTAAELELPGGAVAAGHAPPASRGTSRCTSRPAGARLGPRPAGEERPARTAGARAGGPHRAGRPHPEPGTHPWS